MPAAKRDLLIQQGDSFMVFFRIRREPGDYRDLSGLVGKGQIRVTADSEGVLAEFHVTIPDQTNPDHKGVVMAKLTPHQTSALLPSNGYPDPSLVWSIYLEDDHPGEAKWRKTYIEGGVSVKARITR